MKKISTAMAGKSEKVGRSETDGGAGSGRPINLVLCSERSGRSSCGTEAGDNAEGNEGSLRRDAAQPDRAGNGDAFTVGEPVVE